MRPFFPPLAAALAALITLPALPSLAGAASTGSADPAVVGDAGASWIARGGGGGGGRGGGGRGGGGGGRSGGGSRGGGGGRAHSGFQGSGSSFSRGDRRPQGGFSQGNRTSRVGNPSLERPSRPSRPAAGVDRPALRPEGTRPRPERLPGDRPANLGDRRPDNLGDRTPGDRNLGDRNLGERNLGERNLSERSLTVNRDWNRQVNIGDIDIDAGWARPGWGVARPWNWGWYGGWNNPPWGWWGARAAAWGIGTLATAAIINDAVDDAVQANQTTIVVPNTGYQLLYGTVEPTGSTGITFVVQVGSTNYQLTADCQSGLLNGREPSSSQEAELLNAACQVAYGTAS
jgi:hypothetical protein